MGEVVQHIGAALSSEYGCAVYLGLRLGGLLISSRKNGRRTRKIVIAWDDLSRMKVTEIAVIIENLISSHDDISVLGDTA